MIDNADISTEKEKSSRLLSSLYGSHSRKTTPRRPTSDGDKQKVDPVSPTRAEHGEKDRTSNPTLLRKRTMSQGDIPRLSAGDGTLKAGQSILEQIGTPDHNGWMRKKGERYNSWKMRYFVLKGPHLYCLRSNSKTVRRNSTR